MVVHTFSFSVWWRVIFRNCVCFLLLQKSTCLYIAMELKDYLSVCRKETFFFYRKLVHFTVTCYKILNVFYLGNEYVNYSLYDVLA